LEPSAERPAYSVGEQWLLKDGVYELTKIEKNRYVWASNAGRQIHLTKDLALVSVLKDRIWEWDVTPVPEIAWPLEVGKWGLMHRATLRMRSQPSGIPVRLSWQVKVYEDVRVVGGLFKAFQIVYAANVDTGDPFRGGLQVPGAQSWQVTAWYAPEVRRIVKIQSTSIDALNFEVISLEHPPTVAAPAPPPAAVVPATPPPARGARGPAVPSPDRPRRRRPRPPSGQQPPPGHYLLAEGPAAGEPADPRPRRGRVGGQGGEPRRGHAERRGRGAAGGARAPAGDARQRGAQARGGAERRRRDGHRCRRHHAARDARGCL
jgi:hypothetical protein